MSGTGDSGTPPPEVPEEFAAAYRAAYEQAMGAQADADAGTHRAPAEPAPPSRLALWWAELRGSRERRRPLVLTALAVLVALVLVLAAYVVGRALGGDDRTGTTGTSHQPGGTTEPTGTHHPHHRTATAGAWQGAVQPVKPTAARASCTAPPGVDSAGHKVTYQVTNVLDGRADTAWRCDGDGHGVTLTFTLPSGTEVGELGLVPGYAKTDPVSHADRYAQNNRLTAVRWTIGGHSYVQHMDGSARDRSLRTMRVPRTAADTVTLEVLRVRRGPRDTTAISEVDISAVAG